MMSARRIFRIQKTLLMEISVICVRKTKTFLFIGSKEEIQVLVGNFGVERVW